MGYFVPEALKNSPNWLVWRLVDTGDPKPRKVPYSPKTGRWAHYTDRQELVSYDEALNYYKYAGQFVGLGYVIFEDSGLVFIDVDNCISETGELSELANNILKLFKNTFTEISQSEKGLHIICKGKIPKPTGIKRDDIGLEIYADKRYIAFTGNAINTVEPTEQQPAINALISRYAPEAIQEPKEQPKRPKTVNFVGCDIKSAEDIINNIKSKETAQKFIMLHNGKWQDIGIYATQNQADQAYINIVNYYTNGKDELTEAIWRTSELAKRPKAERPDYIDRTIKKAKIYAEKRQEKTPTSGHKNIYKSTFATDIKERKPKKF